MGKIIGIDYGKKKVGFAISDSLGISTNPLGTIMVQDVWKFIDKQVKDHEIDVFVVGYATHKDGTDAESMKYIHPFVKGLRRKYSDKEVVFENENYTSVIAEQSLIELGAKKKKRQDKKLVDTISAMLILQSYLDKQTKQ